jgi:hypothetical protein
MKREEHGRESSGWVGVMLDSQHPHMSLNERMPPVRRNYEGDVKTASQTPQETGFGCFCTLGGLVRPPTRNRSLLSIEIGRTTRRFGSANGAHLAVTNFGPGSSRPAGDEGERRKPHSTRFREEPRERGPAVYQGRVATRLSSSCHVTANSGRQTADGKRWRAKRNDSPANNGARKIAWPTNSAPKAFPHADILEPEALHFELPSDGDLTCLAFKRRRRPSACVLGTQKFPGWLKPTPPSLPKVLTPFPQAACSSFRKKSVAFGPKCANSHPPKRSASQKDNARLTSDSGWPGQELDGGRRSSTWFETIRHGE